MLLLPRQEEVVVIKFVGRVCVVIAALLGAVLTPRLGPWKTLVLGSCLFPLAPLVLAMSPGQTGPYVEAVVEKFADVLNRTTM